MENTKLKSKRIPELDGLRGIAILLVLIWHYVIDIKHPYFSDMHQNFQIFWSFSWTGVDLFFVLSGFLIGGILIDHKGSLNYFQTFYIRRICRIFPLYFFWLFLFVVIVFSFPNWVKNFPNHKLFNDYVPLWSYFIYIQNFFYGLSTQEGPYWLGITWSLAVEEHFYLILPTMIYFLPRKRLPHVLWALVILSPLVRALLFQHPPKGMMTFFLMPGRMDCFFLGVIGAILYRNHNYMTIISKNLHWIYVGTTIILIQLISMCYRNVSMVSWDMASYGFTLVSFFYWGLLMIALTEKKGLISTILRLSILRNLGIIAYGVYIFHQGINGLLHGLIRKDIPFHGNIWDMQITLCAFILTIFIAKISWTYFEKPIVEFGHKFHYKDKQTGT